MPPHSLVAPHNHSVERRRGQTATPSQGIERTHRSRGNNKLNLTPRSRNQLAKLVAHALEQAKPVVLRQRREKVLDGGLGRAGLLLQLGDDGRLVGGRQAGRRQDGAQLGVLCEEAAEAVEGLGCRLDGRGLCGGGVLSLVSILPSFPFIAKPPRACCMAPMRVVRVRSACLSSFLPLLREAAIKPIDPPSTYKRPSKEFMRWRKAYQSSGIGAIEPKDGNGRLDVRSRGRGGRVAAHRRRGAQGSRRSHGADDGLSRQHRGDGRGDIESGSVVGGRGASVRVGVVFLMRRFGASG